MRSFLRPVDKQGKTTMNDKINTMSKLTYRKLKLAGACESQAKLFRTLFPEGVVVTEAVCISVASNFDWDLDWAAAHLLPKSLRAEYERQRAPLWAEYERQRAPIWAEYERQHAPIQAEYERQCASLRAEYHRQREPLRGRVRTPARADLGRVRPPMRIAWGRVPPPARAASGRVPPPMRAA